MPLDHIEEVSAMAKEDVVGGLVLLVPHSMSYKRTYRDCDFLFGL